MTDRWMGEDNSSQPTLGAGTLLSRTVGFASQPGGSDETISRALRALDSSISV